MIGSLPTHQRLLMRLPYLSVLVLYMQYLLRSTVPVLGSVGEGWPLYVKVHRTTCKEQTVDIFVVIISILAMCFEWHCSKGIWYCAQHVTRDIVSYDINLLFRTVPTQVLKYLKQVF